MKFQGWMTEPRWEWEKERKVKVFAVNEAISAQVPNVVKYIEELLDEFRIPLYVSVADSKDNADLGLVKVMIFQSLKGGNKVDYPEFEGKLNESRGRDKLTYGVILIIDKEKFEFYKRPEQPNLAIYGIGDCNGYVILRHTHRESVRHEFAHMLGLGHHDSPNPKCIMNWECAIPSFCDGCKRKINEMWKYEIDTGKTQ